jgi:hypothetical protein
MLKSPGRAALLWANGANLRAIAAQLNESRYTTRRGKALHPMYVQRLLAHATQLKGGASALEV